MFSPDVFTIIILRRGREGGKEGGRGGREGGEGGEGGREGEIIMIHHMLHATSKS